ncbi:MAG TPA: YggS family pyridoxal phosphate-dependent enzyme [Thermoanaerobaculia bacterium]|nr:YggS family pyridoxal phosphate-dependent enzyme [Thermoanaerobaculia bacterium]
MTESLEADVRQIAATEDDTFSDHADMTFDEEEPSEMEPSIATNLDLVEKRISAACQRSGRARKDVLLVAVSKTFPVEAIDSAVRAGVSDIGENRVQEMRSKLDLLASKPRLHLIGSLQSNKVKPAVAMFDVIQTVDSLSLATRIARESEIAGRMVELFIQVNVGSEPQKGGIEMRDAGKLASQVAALPHVALTGLMAIPPFGPAEETRLYFRKLRALHEELRRDLSDSFRALSIGMSDDFDVAIEEGATVIRVGRGIFGTRSSNAGG